MNIITKTGYRLASLLNKIIEKHRLNYFRYIHGRRVDISDSVSFDKGSNIVFSAETTTAKLFIGEGSIFRRYCNLRLSNASGLNIGKRNFFNNGCSITCLNSIIIGNDNLFGEGVKLYDHNHSFRDKNTVIQNQGFNVGKITIGNNCWFGSNCVILNNVIIGDNVVVGANVLVYKSIESNTIVRANVSNEFIHY